MLDKEYIDLLGKTANDLGIALHIDGARIFNACVALGISPSSLCKSASTVSICLSKGLGAPMGSVLVGPIDIIRLARRARKRLGGGTRQVGVVASQGLYAVENNIERLCEDHDRAKRIAKKLYENGFYQPQEGNVQTNIVYFGLPSDCTVKSDEFAQKLKNDFKVLIGSGYSKGGKLFRVCTHLDVNENDVDYAINSILKLASISRR